MTIDALVKPFLGVPIFEGLKPLQITEIARRADRIVYKPGEVIVRENAEGEGAVLIVSGEALRVSGPELAGRSEPVPAGSLLAEMAMLVETEHSSTVVARTRVRAFRILRAELYAQITGDPRLADHFLQKVTGKLLRLADELRAIDQTLATPAEPESRSPQAQVAAWPAHRT